MKAVRKIKLKFSLAALLLAGGAAHAEPVNIYVADDFHPVEDVAEMAANAAAVLDGQRIILVRDGQIPRLRSQAPAIAEAQAAKIKFFVCEADLNNYKGASLPSGFSIVKVQDETHKEPLLTTFDKKLNKICSE